jgi:hypothetical protein
MPKRKRADQLDARGATSDVGETTAAMPDRETVAQRAYELYLERGASEGQAMEDWLRAERELARARSRGNS